MKHFPKDFLWGASTSAMQTEGGIENNDWAEAVRQGKAPDMLLACDSYHRYEEDFDIAKSLGHNANRFSMEWARVEPEEGVFDEKELEHYRAVARALRARGMEPFVTIWHFSLPLWFVQRGSFGRRDAPAIFARYAAKIAEAFGNDVTFYITINEPEVWLGEVGKYTGAVPSFHRDPLATIKIYRRLVASHRKAYEAIKRIRPDAQIAVAKPNFSFEARGPFGAIVAWVGRRVWNRLFLDLTRRHQDFIGIQFYQRLFFWQSKKERQEAQKSDIGWQLHPDALYDVLIEAKRYHLPIYVTESGIADAKDHYRAWFIEESVKAMHRAIEDGADVRGYLHWSLLDNYEFLKGFSMKFGLVYVDHEGDRKRTIRPSARAYADIIKNNGGIPEKLGHPMS